MTSPIPPARKRRGCLFYFGIVFVVMLLVLGLMAFFTVRFVKNQILAYTDPAPMQLPVVEMSDSEFAELDERVTAFGKALERGEAVEPLTLTEREINVLLSRRPELKELANKVYVSLKENQVSGQVSIPLRGLGWIAKDRYVNGEAAFNVSLENGVLIVTAQELKVKDQPVPEKFMTQLRQENLAREAYKDAKTAEAIRKIDRIEILDGRVIITGRKS